MYYKKTHTGFKHCFFADIMKHIQKKFITAIFAKKVGNQYQRFLINNHKKILLSDGN